MKCFVGCSGSVNLFQYMNPYTFIGIASSVLYHDITEGQNNQNQDPPV